MAVNPVGYVSPLDGGNPRIITAIASEVISGGQLCHSSGAADCVSSGINSYATSDITVATGASGAKFNGVAIQAAASGGAVGLATRGLVLMRAGGTIVNGQAVAANGADDVLPLASTSGADVPVMLTAGILAKMGRAWTNATSGNYALIEITP